MVKGTNRRVIVVRSPDPKLFEEAIFVLRENGDREADAGLIMEQASRAAGEYLKKCGVRKVRGKRRVPSFLIVTLCLLLAGAAMAAAWYFVF